MIKGIVYLKDYLVFNSELQRGTNHFLFEIHDLSELDETLAENNVQLQDVNIIDFR